MRRLLLRTVVFVLSSALVLFSAACGKDGDGRSSDDSNPSGSQSGLLSSESGENTEYRKLIDQLDDLENVLKELDQISESDTEIPTP